MSAPSTRFTMELSSSTIRRLSHIASHLHRPKIVVTRDLGPHVMSILHAESANYEIVVWTGTVACDRTWLLQNAKGAVALLVLVTDKIDSEVLEAAGPQLQVVSTMSVGYEHIDVKALAKRSIKLGYTPDVLTDAVADISIMLALMASRLARTSMDFVTSNSWPTSSWSPFAFCGSQLSTTPSSPTRTVGFLGFGRIAQAVLRRLTGFGFTHCLYTTRTDSPPNPERDAALLASLFPIAPGGSKIGSLETIKGVDLLTLARESDVVFVLTPGGESTYHLVNEEFLRTMKKTSVLVNTSRGSVVDSEALGKALKGEWIWGAGVDVVEGEPNVGADHLLVKEPRCVVLPHIGSATYQTRLDMATLTVKNALAALRGEEMPYSVNLSQ